MIRHFLTALSLSLLLIGGLSAQKKKNKKDTEPPTQVLPPLPDPPEAIVADTARLSFQVSPLSNKGLLSQQIRDALKALLHDNHGAQIVKLRAFVAGSGDLRRVQQIVVDEFTDKKLSLPVISTIQVGALPMVGAQVVIEATSMEKQAANVMLEYFPSVNSDSMASAIEDLRTQSKAYEMAQVTCFVTSLDGAAGARASLIGAFPKSAVDLVQSQRQSVQPYFGCEGIGRRERPNQIAILGGPLPYILGGKIILTGTKLVFRDEEADIRLAFQRQIKALEALGATKDDIVWTEIYPLTNPMATKVRDMRREFMTQVRLRNIIPPLFEGLPSTDATAAIEMIARGH